MGRVTLATDDEDLRADLVDLLAGAGLPVTSAASWEGLLASVASPRCALALVDSRLPGLVPELLQTMAASCSHGPELRALRGPAAPLAQAPSRHQDLLRLARKVTRAGIDAELRNELRLLGAGGSTFVILGRLAAGTFPVLIQGERGSGKERLARALHQISGDPGPFRVQDLDAPPWSDPGTEPGTIYVERVDERLPEAVDALSHQVRRAGWRFLVGSRRAVPDLVGRGTWNHLHLVPLRERPEELRRLTRLYLDRYRRQLGLPRRRFQRSLWALVLSHRWPGNARELETFVVQALTGTQDSVIRAEALPESVRRLVDPAPDAQAMDLAAAFETVVEARLRALVQQVEPDSGIAVRRLAVDATERALYRLALARTGGNQLAAAQLLGIARNTLRSRAARLGVLGL